MTKITLEKFIEKTKGTKVDVPWKTTSNLKGQCVSLIQQYISQCLEQPAKARGNAKDWVTSYPKEGLGKVVKTPQKGDILVFTKEGTKGHIAIYIDKNKMYDQNNGRHDNRCAGYGTIFTNDYVVLRPNVKLLEVADPIKKYSKGRYIMENPRYIRTGAGTNYAIKKVKDITANAKTKVVNTKLTANAQLKKGATFDVSEVKYASNKSIWGKIPSGWVCLESSTGTIYVKKG